MITAVIIDDEKECIEDLIYLIGKLNLPVKIVGKAGSGEQGLAVILKYKPQLVFLDVVMPGMTGFEMLELLPELNFNLIITTSMDKYAIQAIRASALDFLLKPVKSKELKDSISRIEQKYQAPDRSQLELLKDNMLVSKPKINKIALVIKDGVQLVDHHRIEYFHSEGNYTHVHLTDGESILVSKPLGKFEEAVSGSTFFRVHNSYLINIDHVSKFIRSDGGYVVLTNGGSIPVSRSIPNTIKIL